MKGYFPDPTPTTEWLAPRQYRLIQPFSYVAKDGTEYTAHAGLIFDWASIPRFLWPIYPPDGSWAPAAVLHDAFYEDHDGTLSFYPGMTRKKADALFLEMLEVLGVPWLRRRLFYRAVRLFGGRAWRT